MKNYSFDYFSVLVIGNNPDEQICKFDSMVDVDTPYILYKFSDLHKLRKIRIDAYREIANKFKYGNDRNSILDKIKELKNTTDEQFYAQLGELYMYDLDKNIISTENPDGKWISCEKGGRIFSNYLKDFNDNGVISAKKSDIDWSLTHMREDKVNLYNRTWDLCVNNVTPVTEKDKQIVNNMKLHEALFKNFKNKEEYVRMSCSFWTYAILYNGNWVDMEFEDDHKWNINFYDNFIKNLSNNELITIYECTK